MSKPINQKELGMPRSRYRRNVIATAVVSALASTSAFAQALPTTGTIELPIGPLDVKNGYPTEKTVAKLYEALDGFKLRESGHSLQT